MSKKGSDKIDKAEIEALERGLNELKAIVEGLNAELREVRIVDPKRKPESKDNYTDHVKRPSTRTDKKNDMFRLPFQALVFIGLYCFNVLLLQNLEVPLHGSNSDFNTQAAASTSSTNQRINLKFSVCSASATTNSANQNRQVTIDTTESIKNAKLAIMLIPDYLHGLVSRVAAYRRGDTVEILGGQQVAGKVVTISVPYLEPLTVSIVVGLAIAVWRYLQIIANKATETRQARRALKDAKNNKSEQQKTPKTAESLGMIVFKWALSVPVLVIQCVMLVVVFIGVLNNVAVIAGVADGRPLIMC